MDCGGRLNYFRTVGRSSAMLAGLIHLLTVSVVLGAASQFDDEPCLPRPEVVELKHEGNHVKPYHILLYRCKGTCDNRSPIVQPCTESSTKDVEVSAQTAAGMDVTVKMVNHTSCSCNCVVICDYENGEQLDSKNCRCLPAPYVGQSGERNPAEKSGCLPFVIGMALVGFFALCVLVFDAMMYAKRLGVMHSIKTGCCSRSEERPHCNGCAQSPTHEITAL